MSYSENLAAKVRRVLAAKPGFSEKKMFGGVCFFLRENMCCGIVGDKLMLRVKPEDQPKLMKQKHVAPMDFTGRPSKGMIYVLPAGLKSSAAVAKWVKISVEYVRGLPRKSGA